MKKRWGLLIGVMALFTWSQSAGAAAASQDIKVEINGKLQTYEQPPVIVDDRTLVPMRGIFEALGAEVLWYADTETVTATKDGTRIALVLGSKAVKKDDQWIQIDVEPRLINSRTMVPMRFVSEAFGADVEWDEPNKTVIIHTKEQPGQPAAPTQIPLPADYPYPVNTSLITNSNNRSYEQRKETRYVVIHETVSKADARAQLNYFNTANADANAHVFIDWKETLLTLPMGEKSWTVGRPANDFTYNIELSHARNRDEFVRSWEIAVRYTAEYVMYMNQDPMTFIKSHHDISGTFGGTDHTDPDEYFAEFGRTMNDFRNDVAKKINELQAK